MKKSAIILLLAALMTLSACSGGGDAAVTSGAAQTSVETETTVETTEARVLPDLPAKTFNGKTFKVRTFLIWEQQYLDAEEQNGDVLNDAVFARNSRISEKYDVEFEFKFYDRGPSKVIDDVKTAVASGDASIDLAMPSTNYVPAALAGGYFTELHDVPYFDLEKPWWDARSIADLSMGGRNFFALNSLCVRGDNLTAAVFFNKTLIDNYKLDDPYKLVDSNVWTWSKMYEMSKSASSDLDGDGQMTDLDRYGVITSFLGLQDGMLNCGEPVLTKDKDDFPVLALGSARAATVAETIFKIMTDAKNTLCVDRYSGTGKYADAWLNLMYPAFKEGRGLFVARAYVQYVYYFRDSDVDYGIVPRPKYDEAQERYYHDVNNAWADCITVPAAVADLEMTGIITEALAADSLYSVTPANYDVSIINKQIRDEDSARMLEIIYSSRVFDYGQIATWTGMRGKLQLMVKNGSFTLASDLAAEKAPTEANVAKFAEEYKKLK